MWRCQETNYTCELHFSFLISPESRCSNMVIAQISFPHRNPVFVKVNYFIGEELATLKRHGSTSASLQVRWKAEVSGVNELHWCAFSTGDRPAFLLKASMNVAVDWISGNILKLIGGSSSLFQWFNPDLIILNNCISRSRYMILPSNFEQEAFFFTLITAQGHLYHQAP